MGIKARDIRLHCAGKVDESVVRFLEGLAEEQTAIKQTLLEIAQMQDRVINALSDTVSLTSNLQKQVVREVLGREKSAESMVERRITKDPLPEEPSTR